MSALSFACRRDYWNQAALDTGPRSLDKELSENSTWADVLETGEFDLAKALKSTTLTFGPDRTALEIGCGAGRMTHALGLRYGKVFGVDIASRMIEMAESRRHLPNVSFALADEQTIAPATVGRVDSIFSYEVFHYLPTELLNQYLKQSFERLNPGGELVFQLNVVPITPLTWVSFQFRSLMFAMGIKEWRRWSNDPAFQRQYHSPSTVISQLQSIGFDVDTPRGQPRQTWFRAVRPAND